MSLGYADRLSYREDLGGRLGAPELHEAPHVVLDRALQLAELVRAAERVLVYTGAGISTACGIPDFRGPAGVWTAQRRGLPMPQAKVSFLYAQPSLTHMALAGLMRARKLGYVCSQNVDSLHLRSGIPRAQLAELHGNCFAERCSRCKTEYVRDFEMDTVGFKPTGRSCTQAGCGAPLVDHILDWEDPLPPAELKATEQHGSAASLALCLGTSLQIIPAANLPLRTTKAGGQLAIINLQATPKDKHASVVIHAKVDQVLALVMQQLGLPIPTYVRTDRVLLSHRAATAPAGVQQQQQQQQGHAAEEAAAGQADAMWSFDLTLASVHGPECPLPMVASAAVRFYGRLPQLPQPSNGAAAAAPAAAAPAAAAARAPDAAAPPPVPATEQDITGLQEVLPAQQCAGQLPWRTQRVVRASLARVVAVVQLQLVDAADAGRRQPCVHYTIERPAAPQQAAGDAAARAGSGTRRASRSATAQQRQLQQQPDHVHEFSFVTQVREYGEQQQQLVDELQAAAAASRAAVGTPAEVPQANGSYSDYEDDESDDAAAGDDGAGSGDSDFVPSGGRKHSGAKQRKARGGRSRASSAGGGAGRKRAKQQEGPWGQQEEQQQAEQPQVEQQESPQPANGDPR